MVTEIVEFRYIQSPSYYNIYIYYAVGAAVILKEEDDGRSE